MIRMVSGALLWAVVSSAAPAAEAAVRCHRTGHHVCRGAIHVLRTPRWGAMARCRDGADSLSRHRSGACMHHGGVVRWL
jgi:hypothetical protein